MIRIDLDGLVGIKHSENFEYVCEVTEQDAESIGPLKMFLDTDFPSDQKYRLATAFPNGPVSGAVGIEAPVVSESSGRCGGKVCAVLILKMDASDPGQEMAFHEFKLLDDIHGSGCLSVVDS